MNTIFAQSSAHGKSGVTVYRISGPNSLNILQILSRKTNWNHSIMKLIKLYSSKDELIDEAMAVYFKSPKTFTGEDVVEIFTHGSIAVKKLLYSAILDTSLAEIAEPGEFTKRAVLNGKMDLTSAEGLIDLINAETYMQHKQSIRQLSGDLEKKYDLWREKLLKIMSLVEAFIDFPDEEIPNQIFHTIEQEKKEIISYITNHINDNRRGERLRSGILLTIFGEPNSGKSTLTNFLTNRDVSIVSEIAGTTRDIIESHIDLAGFPIILNDTAGIRKNTNDIIEKEGIKKAENSIKNSDIKIWLMDISNFIKNDDFNLDKSKNYFQESNFLNYLNENTLLVINKIDSIFKSEISEEISKFFKSFKIEEKNIIFISLKENYHLNYLLDKIKLKCELVASPSNEASITRVRHRNLLQKCLLSLNQCNFNDDLVLAAEDLRMAARYLGKITGKIDPEEILSEIFSNFCIGK